MSPPSSLLLTVEESTGSFESRADTPVAGLLWDQPGNQNLLFLPRPLNGWVPLKDTVPICPPLELDPTEDKTETQGPERGPPRMALESRSEGGWVL